MTSVPAASPSLVYQVAVTWRLQLLPPVLPHHSSAGIDCTRGAVLELFSLSLTLTLDVENGFPWQKSHALGLAPPGRMPHKTHVQVSWLSSHARAEVAAVLLPYGTVFVFGSL